MSWDIYIYRKETLWTVDVNSSQWIISVLTLIWATPDFNVVAWDNIFNKPWAKTSSPNYLGSLLWAGNVSRTFCSDSLNFQPPDKHVADTFYLCQGMTQIPTSVNQHNCWGSLLRFSDRGGTGSNLQLRRPGSQYPTDPSGSNFHEIHC